MFKSYWRRVHQRALREARHALSLETKHRIVRLFLGTALSIAAIVFLASEAGYTTNLLSRIFLAFAALGIATVLLVAFYIWNFVHAPAQLDKEAQERIGDLTQKLNDREEQQKIRLSLWKLREEGVQIRNDGLTTTNIASWADKFETWHARVLDQAQNLSSDLRHSLDPIDKISPESNELVVAKDISHQKNVSVMSEMLARLYKHLDRTS